MKKVSEYRQHAAECRSLAAGMPNDEHRVQLLDMAATWDRLAVEREKSLGVSEPASFDPKGSKPEPGPPRPS